VNLLLGAFLVAHGLVHALYLAPAPPRTSDGPQWPFDTGRSWLVTAAGLDHGAARALGTALVAATVALLAGAGLASVGWLMPVGSWPALVVGGASASLLTLALFFHPSLVIGAAIDAMLLWAALVTEWSPAAASVP
jgi:hypothetical protein